MSPTEPENTEACNSVDIVDDHHDEPILLLDHKSPHYNHHQRVLLVHDPAPNGGYGWVIVGAAFALNMIGDGVANTFGLFFDILISDLSGASKSKVALCGALLIAFCLGAGKNFWILIDDNLKPFRDFWNFYLDFSGPIVGSLINKYGFRRVAISGGSLWFVALMLSSVAPNVGTLMVTYGMIGML